MGSSWRYITFRLLFKDKFDARFFFYWGFGLVLTFIARGFSVHLWLLAFITIFEVYRVRNKLYSLSDAFKCFLQRRFGRNKHGHKRSIYGSSNFALILLVFVASKEVQAGFKIVMPDDYKPPVSSIVPEQQDGIQNGTQYWPKGDEFVDNVTVKSGGARDIALERLLGFLLPAHFKTTFISVEIADMEVQWYSDNWTLDQIMGNLAVRYGIMFERIRGTADIRVDWYDEKRCLGADERNRVIRTLCGTTESYL